MSEVVILDEETARKSFLGRLVRLILIVLIIVAIVSAIKAVKGAGKGKQMTEAEVRERFDKMASKVGDDRAGAMADKVVDKMRDKGVLIEEEEAAGDEDGDDAEEAAGDEDEEAAAAE